MTVFSLLILSSIGLFERVRSTAGDEVEAKLLRSYRAAGEEDTFTAPTV